jgi:dienelactone hydrolase
LFQTVRPLEKRRAEWPAMNDFTEFLQQYGVDHPPSMRYSAGENFFEWQSRFFEKVRELLEPWLPRTAARVEILSEEDCGTHRRLRLNILLGGPYDLPAFLLIPKGASKTARRAGVIALHGHVKYGMAAVAGLPNEETDARPYEAYGRDAVEAGYVVLAPAWWGWYGRDGHVKHVANRDKCDTIQTAASMYGFQVLTRHIQDGQSAIDVLCAREEVDSDRIGCIGNSYGGRTTMYLAIFDQRIRACVAAGCANLFRERSLKLTSCGIQYPYGLLRYGDVGELFSLIAPRPLQLLTGKADDLMTPADRDAIAATLRNAYERAGAPGHFEYALNSHGHSMVWDDAKRFLAQHLPVRK